MAKYDKRSKAQLMREKGISIIVIARKLGVSKSSVSAWCRDIILTEEQFEKLRKNIGISQKTGQRMGAETNKKKRLNAINLADIWGKKMVKKISKRELLLIATALYWSEGAKTDSTSRFMFANSDPNMILLMKNILIQVMEVAPSDIVCGIQINRIHEKRIRKVLIFWKKLLELRDSQLNKPYFVNTKVNKVYENYDNYFGVCRLFVRRSKNLKYKMLGLIKAVKGDILSA
ncbi:hypothetical protein A2733_01035 [Candidatus Nomurabacteria bacterium RIFCSPHIGHO2_01_FULL_40_20]|uniref:HTH cro/C1-type domain-containing protein n=1 Tax=Candidatus Nomurabacteria bacterium RIFCSPHIGHO2_01_FULL_40_20 TaxID=1801738 RepID=A0A1F6V2Z2_9BACT|nr:MAG: hypothetical protein A2733_01035 [Candidatus Nomurabacteria bacterium RIFCSPHIGHO2_01_FULL_40_20]